MDLEIKIPIIMGAVIVAVLIIVAGFSTFNKYILGNKQFIDMKQTFNTAYVAFPDGTSQKIQIQSWRDYDNSDSIQIIDMSGKPFYTHLNRVILTKE